MDELLTPGEFGKHFGVTAQTVREWVKAGKVRGVRLPSGRWKIPYAEVDRIKEEN